MSTDSNTLTNSARPNDSTLKKNKYLMFSLAEEKYGIPLSSVKEIIGMVDITPVPQATKFFKGLINLRGQVISVMDLRSKLNITAKEYAAKKTSIIIIEIDTITVGAIVDDVHEVFGLEQSQIEPALHIEKKVDSNYILGVAKTEEANLIILLDIGKTLSIENLKEMKQQQDSQS